MTNFVQNELDVIFWWRRTWKLNKQMISFKKNFGRKDSIRFFRCLTILLSDEKWIHLLSVTSQGESVVPAMVCFCQGSKKMTRPSEVSCRKIQNRNFRFNQLLKCILIVIISEWFRLLHLFYLQLIQYFFNLIFCLAITLLRTR